MPRARKKQTGWSYTAGEKGVNRVRVFVHRNGNVFAEYKRDGRKIRESLGHADLVEAKRQADEMAAALRRPDHRKSITLGELFDNYVREKTPTKGQSGQYHDRRAVALFTRVYGADRLAETLTHRDADRFIHERKRLGDLRPRGTPKKGDAAKPVHHPIGPRIIASDLKLLKAILNWGVGAGWLLANPLQYYKVGEHGTPHRPVFTDPDYRALLAVAPQFPRQFGTLLILAHETGHRLGSLLNLRWSDVDFENGRLTWRQESDKIGYQHTTPMTGATRTALEEARRMTPGIGDTLILPNPDDRSREISRHLARDWMQRAQTAAGLPPVLRRGWHAFRRNFASEHRHVPLRDLIDLGGWKDHHTIIKCYQGPNEETMRLAQASRRVLEA